MEALKVENNNVWLRPSEVGQLLNISKRHVNRIISKYVCNNHNGQNQILLSSLPEWAQLKYHSSVNNELSQEIHLRPIKEMTDSQKEIAKARYDILVLWKKYRSETRLKAKEADLKFQFDFNEGEAFPELKKVIESINVKSLYRWCSNKGWEKDYTKLAPNYKTGEQGPLVTDAQAERLLFYVKNPNRLKVSEIIRFAKTDMERNNIPVDKSDDTFRRYIMKWAKDHQDQWVFFREGEKALNDKNTPYLKRDRDLVEVGDLLVIDGHTLNFEIINPATGRPKRMTLILVFDYKSDYPLGWEIMPSENTYAITSAVRHALIRLGFKGRVVNIDNGRANKSKWFLGKFEECGIQGMFYKVFESVMIAQPYHGQSKTIERFFGSFSELERTLPTYSGTSIAMKPPRMMRAEKFHKNIYTKMTEGMALDIYQANYLVALWFDEFVKRPHADGFYKGLTPQEVYNDSIAKVMSKPDFESRLISKEELNFMMLSERVTTLYRNGIRFRGTEYFSPELYPFEKGADKHQFRIKYDDIEPETILVYDDKTGKYICEAKAKEYVHPLAKYMGTEEDKLRLAEQLGEKNRLLSGTIKTAKEYFEEYQSRETGKTVKLIEMKQIQTSAARQLRNKKEGNTDEGIELDYSDAQVSTEIDEDDIDLAITN